MACTEDPSVGLPERPYRGPQAAADSPLYVHYPEIDLRIARLDPRSGAVRALLYPDLWHADTRAVRDFALDETRLFALLSTHDPVADATLFVADLQDGQLEDRIALPAAPRVLGWGSAGQLLVGHFTSQEHRGYLSVVDTQNLRPLTQVALQGSCISVTADGADAYAIERVECRGAKDGPFAIYRLVHIDLDRGTVKRRLELPAGARQVVIGPTGLLYVSHASGVGLHASDGTLSVVDALRWTLVDRVRLDMIVRHIEVTPDRLVLNMLSRSGEAWFSVLRPDHSTLYDFRFDELVTGELAVIGSQAFVPQRGQNGLLRVQMSPGPRVDRLAARPKVPYSDRPGLLRTVVARRGVTDAH